jgi:PadR family transcriptional regulator PadR
LAGIIKWTGEYQTMAQTNPPFMSGVPELLVLQLLGRGEMYGYELVKAVRLVTGEAISLGEGVIYPVLHGLEKNGALKAKRKEVNGRTRVYYSVTAKGRKRFDRLAKEWDRVSFGVRSALGAAADA